MNQKIFRLIAIAVFSFCVTVGCYPVDRQPTESASPSVIQVANTEDSADTVQRFLDSQPSETTPNRFVIVQDMTGSLEEHRVKRLQSQQLKPLLALLADKGGEIAVLNVCEDSNNPMYRLRISQHPQFDSQVLVNPTPPTSVDPKVNPFQRREKEKEYQKALLAYRQTMDTDLAIVADHQQLVKDWQTSSKAESDRFLAEIKSLWDKPHNCLATDIYGAIRRAELFFNEDTTIWTREPQNWIVFITDGIHNTPNQAASLSSDTKVLLVNGGNSTGIFEDIPHLGFEAPSAAIQHIVHNASEE
ncbi:MAG: hypothetical protein AAFQ14_07275 [Cyanobacteria bacterium J06621_12]